MRLNWLGLKISASIYAQTDKDLETLVSELDALHVDYFHVDCNDDLTVFQDVEHLAKLSDTPVDIHIISETPNNFISAIERLKPQRVCFQYESLPSHFSFPKIEGVKFGLAVKTETPIDVFKPFESACEFILVMATTPGQSGGKFNPVNFKKIRDFMRQYPNKEVEVDGGVNDEVSFILRNYGVPVAVVGSFLMKHEVQGRALSLLKHEHTESHYKVGDMMIVRENLPVLNIHTASFQSILECNEAHFMGYVLFEDDKGNFAGISTNADVRKGLLKHKPNFNALQPEDVINPSPISVKDEQTIAEMFQLLKSKKQTISYLPVVNDENHLVGAVNFNTLIKGEL